MILNMKMTLNKLLSYFLILLSIIICMSSENWFTIWLSMELNLISIIPLMYNYNYESSICMIKYFLIQSITSNSLLMCFIYNTTPFIAKMYSVLILILLLTKMGLAPLYMWFPPIMEYLSWMIIFMMLTIQKFIPLQLIYTINIDSKTFTFFTLINIWTGSIMMFFYTSLRKILTFSSMSHAGWVFINMNMEGYWLTYMMIYMAMLLPGIYYFNMFGTSVISQLPMTKNTMLKINTLIFFLSNSGFPPFAGFYLKWMTFSLCFSFYNNIIMFLLISSALINCYFYLRTCYPIICSLDLKKLYNSYSSSMLILSYLLINAWPFLL
uniref:NADH-ubiquinone oxidoreductase chain 2 n=1 Tax=Macrocheles glaber TaxID=99226 RepID=A0A6B9WEQ2_9ACAR|nr:NADH dehydrogenase subunit 2 [Macrocheles glaber]QHQ98522.1 NADH dehydrogenase subunit 2 [Macrocheles glaber]